LWEDIFFRLNRKNLSHSKILNFFYSDLKLEMMWAILIPSHSFLSIYFFIFSFTFYFLSHSWSQTKHWRFLYSSNLTSSLFLPEPVSSLLNKVFADAYLCCRFQTPCLVLKIHVVCHGNWTLPSVICCFNYFIATDR